MAADAGVATVVIDQALEDYAALVDAGLGDADTSALITRKRAS
jgi:3-hydroxyisobutyrate dehydrogenase